MTVTVPTWVLIALIVALAISAVTTSLDAWLKWRQLRMAQQLVPGQFTASPVKPDKALTLTDLGWAHLAKGGVSPTEYVPPPKVPPAAPENRYPGDDGDGDKV